MSGAFASSGKWAFAALLAASLALSFANLRCAFIPDADMATPWVVVDAIGHRGWHAVRAWAYTQDNWLLSIILPNLLLSRFMELSPSVIMMEAWFVILGHAALCALIVSGFAGRACALIVGLVLLWAPPSALNGIGVVGHPVSHGVTCVWSLAAIWLFTRHIATGTAWSVAAAVAILLVATTSDPWGRAAFLLPIALSSVLCAVLAADAALRLRFFACAGGGIVTLALGSHPAGLLGFLPSSVFHVGGWSAMPARVAVIARAIPVYFPVIPTDRHAWIADTLLAGLLGAIATFRLLRAARARDIGSATFIGLWALASSCATPAAYAISNLDPLPVYGRFLDNLYVALPILAVIAARGAEWLLLLPVIGLAISTAARLPGDLDHPPGASTASRLLAFLDAHHLTYGYGGYADTEANALGWISAGRVIVRPVILTQSGTGLQSRGAQTYPFWYDRSDVPARQDRVFLVASKELEEGGGHGIDPASLSRSFGPPEALLRWEGKDVLVWNHPILDVLAPESAAPPLPPLAPGAVLDFRRPGSARYMQAGWFGAGPYGIMTIRQRSELWLPVPATRGAMRVCLDTLLAIRRKVPARPVLVAFGDTPSTRWLVGPRLSRQCADDLNGDNRLVLEVPPRTANEDVPNLMLRSMTIEPLSQEAIPRP